MIYLSGAIRPKLNGEPGLGWMFTPQMGNRINLTGVPWAADTGCFTKPESYDQERYLRFLDVFSPFWETCLFATAPDRVGDAKATLEVARPALPLIRTRVPAALVAQDGLEHLTVPWDEFDCLFVGGTTEWKLSEAAYDLVAEAKARGKWAHQGRCNSKKRFIAAAMGGYDSADGTFLAFGPDTNWPRLQGWFQALRQQAALW
jgi:hypothetical protein